jgi:hypothetical protein
MFSDKRLRTIKCDSPECDKIVEFDLSDVKHIQSIEWLKGVRVVQTGDNRSFSYCSDVCEVKGITTGQHNLKEPQPQSQASAAPAQPAVIASATEADVKAAAASAEAQQQLSDDLKNGNANIIVP